MSGKLDDIKNQCLACSSCRLAAPISDRFFMQGKIARFDRVLFIGSKHMSTPEKDAFDKLLKDFYLEESCLTYTVKCPSGDREPAEDEAAACHKWLAHQSVAIDPMCICTLGMDALQAVLGKQESDLSTLNGELFHTRGGRPVVPLLHPGSMLVDELEERCLSGWHKLITHLLVLSKCPF